RGVSPRLQPEAHPTLWRRLAGLAKSLVNGKIIPRAKSRPLEYWSRFARGQFRHVSHESVARPKFKILGKRSQDESCPPCQPFHGAIGHVAGVAADAEL